MVNDCSFEMWIDYWNNLTNRMHNGFSSRSTAHVGRSLSACPSLFRSSPLGTNCGNLYSSIFGIEDGEYQSTALIYRSFILVWHVSMSNLLNQHPAQQHLSRVRPIQLRDLPLHYWMIDRWFLELRRASIRRLSCYCVLLGILEITPV